MGGMVRRIGRKITHSSARTLPHRFEVILNTGFIHTFDAYLVFKDGMGSFNCHLIICLQITGEKCRLTAV